MVGREGGREREEITEWKEVRVEGEVREGGKKERLQGGRIGGRKEGMKEW